MKKLFLGTLILFFLFCGTNAFAVSYSPADILFEDISPDGGINSNFSLEVTVVDGADGAPDTVEFTFTNTGPEISSIDGIYWADMGLLSIPNFSSSTGNVDFKFKTPKANDTPFDDEYFTTAFYARRQNMGQPMGIDVGDSATFTFIADGDVLDAMVSLDLQIFIDVQSGGSNDTYLASIAPTPTPEPATMLLLGAGLIGIAGLGRKKLFKKR
jgi:hypothetical protein